MINAVMSGWPDYELIDSGEGKRLERFFDRVVVRPDPNVIWSKTDPGHKGWHAPDYLFVGKERGKEWDLKNGRSLEGWPVSYGKVRLLAKPSPFRHMGLFPEQSAHWDWLSSLNEQAAKRGTTLRVLNVFAYTGGASISAALGGATVCHVDASKASVYQAIDNARESGLSEQAIRWIVDDALKFLRREVKRGVTYDVILMDPPVFGRGPKGEMWRLDEGIHELAGLARALLSKEAAGLLINMYAAALYPESILRVLVDLNFPFELQLGSLSLQESISKKLLPTGFFIRSK